MSQTINTASYGKELTVAFQADTEMVLRKFEKKSSFKYSDFAQTWRECNFSYIFGGQEYYSLLHQFTENCFFVINKFIVFPKNIYTKVGALYLMYGIFFKQPMSRLTKIRLTQEDYTKLQELVELLRAQKEIEPLYVYAKLIESNAFEFVFLRKPLGPEDRYMNNIIDFQNDTFQTKTTESIALKLEETLNESDFLANLETTNSDYTEALSRYSKKVPGLAGFESTIINDIRTTLDSIRKNMTTIPEKQIDDLQEPGTSKNSREGKYTIISRRRAIRKKAMSNMHAVYRGEKKTVTALDLNLSKDD